METEHVSQKELDNLDKKQLIEKIYSMQQHIVQLKNIIKKYETKQLLTNEVSNNEKSIRIKPKKEFNFQQFQTRHVFLKFLYLGWNYDGFVVQENHSNTIENIIFQALLKTKLIESRETCNYNRCGRTDKGVSAFCQVISLDLRSKTKKDSIQSDNLLSDDVCNEELDYVSILNKVLPNDIRMIAWAPVSNLLSARFDCTRRVYHYYFPRLNLDIDKMNEASRYLVGEHDFRNLCKLDVNNGVLNYKRCVYEASVQINSINKGPCSVCIFRIEASAFLWHQIRFIMAVLFLVGQHLEHPTIVAELLDVEKHPSRPQYSMASDLPLVLFEAHYDHIKVPKWFHEKNSSTLLPELYAEWANKSIQCSIIQSMIDSLNIVDNSPDQFDKIKKLFGNQTKKYKQLFDRPLCDSLECQQMKANKRIKIQ